METINIPLALTTVNIPTVNPAKNLRPKHSRFPVVSALKPSNRTSALNTKDAIKLNSNIATTTTKTVYKDNWFERIAINYLSQAIQDTTGMRNEEIGYESLVVASKKVFKSFNPIEQRQLIRKVLLIATPKAYISMFRTLMPPSNKFSREFCATFTTIFLVWLIGPCEVKESEFEGVKEKNGVYIKKCRFLEASNCAGMCTNLCKVPTQEFMKNTFGMPINMVPNFEDMSCEYIYGVDPPSLQEDPALKQPCYKLCNVKRKHDTSCID